MPNYTIDQLRNVALVGHAATGKTILCEALLAKAGAISAAGSVEEGTTVCDHDPREQASGHSMSACVARLSHGEARVNLIDTPGLPDFQGQALGILPAVETVAVVIDASLGIEMVTRQMMEWAKQRGLCRMIAINKIDAEGVDLEGLLGSIQETFGKECLPINLPTGGGRGVVDCFFNPSGESDFSSVAEAHSSLVDQVVEVDEDLMAVYLEQGEVSPEQLHAPFEAALREGHLIPVCFTSARTGAGIGELLDILERLLPNPREGNPPPFIKDDPEGRSEFHAEPDPDKHVLAHVVKVAFDPFAGKIAVFRVHQGTVRKDTRLFVGEARKPFKPGHLFRVQGKELIETDSALPGDICAVTKVDELEFDAVLHDSHDEDHIHLRPLSLPVPVFGLAVRGKTRNDDNKLSDVLHKLVAEDPGLALEHNVSANETVLRGLGELHLRAALERMQERYRVEVETHVPSIPYRETITKTAEGHHRHKKQTGGAGQFGEVFMRVEPLERGARFEFADQTKGGVIPGAFIPAVEKGIKQALEEGAVAGFPIRDVRAVVYDGKSHSVDSKEVAFIAAGKKAFLDAVLKAAPKVLEPIVDIEITAPSANMGDLTGDLAGRRGRVQDTAMEAGDTVVISGQVPMAELADYQSRLNSITGGAGHYTLQFSHYDPVPGHIQQRLEEAYKPVEEED
jgi:elongation factor G